MSISTKEKYPIAKYEKNLSFDMKKASPKTAHPERILHLFIFAQM